MPLAYVLLTIRPINEEEILKKLRALEAIDEVHMLFGEFDIILRVNADSFDDIAKIVVRKVRSIRGVIDTKTLVSTVGLFGG